MKKLVITLGLFCIVGLSTSELMGQVPVTRTNAAAQTSTMTQADRQVKKGDAQLSKANTSYQRAQSAMTAKPATTTTTARPSTSSSSTARLTAREVTQA